MQEGGVNRVVRLTLSVPSRHIAEAAPDTDVSHNFVHDNNVVDAATFFIGVGL